MDLTTDEQVELLASKLKANDATQNIVLSKERIYKTLTVFEVTDDKIIWQTIYNLIVVVKEQELI